MSLLRTGPAREFIKLLKHSKPFRYARFQQRRRSKCPDRVILGIGQIHAVQRGMGAHHYAKRIAKVQAWIFRACQFLYLKGGVSSIGQEGFAVEPGGAKQARLHPTLINELKLHLASHPGPEKFLRRTAKQWRKAMHSKDQVAIIQTSTALNALNLLQALEEKFSIFPIERRDIHSGISDEINAMYDELEKLDAAPEYQQALKKHGKKLKPDEYTAALRYNELMKKLQKLLRKKERDAAIMENLIEYSKGKHVTVFVLGQAHRKRMLKLKRKLPPEVLFVWVTPPPLRYMHRSIMRILITIIVILILILILNEVT